MLEELHGEIGKIILESWHFPDSLIACVSHHEDIHHNATPHISIGDMVMLANICCRDGDLKYKTVDLDSLPAIAKLGISASELMDVIDNARDDIVEVRQLLAA